jgi:hypothetical protein
MLAHTNVFDRVLFVALLVVVFLTAAACGAESGENESSGGGGDGTTTGSSGKTSGGTTSEGSMEKTGIEEELARAEIGPKEATNMTPADGKKPDKLQPLPENPPEGVKLYPATSTEIKRGDIDYDRDPPTNGPHSPIWQNCGFYMEPIENEIAVHSMDHGVVWISYRPDLPQSQIDELRSYADEDYTIISPYPDLSAPVVATAWRVQIELDGADDPRLRQFVDDFKNTEIAPLSGNRCSGGRGEPEES